jgi:uroporphyrinogen-III decarboxylase
VGIIGGIEPTILLHTPLEKLEAYVEQVIAEAAGGPFVLANSDSCPPGVEAEKFALIARVARRYGKC